MQNTYQQNHSCHPELDSGSPCTKQEKLRRFRNKFGMTMVGAFFLFSSLFSVANAAEAKWVTNFTDCGTTYLSIDCEADQYVCGYDGILHCAAPSEVENAKSDIEGYININSGLGGGLVLNCAANSSSCLPWQCQTDSSCDGQKRATKCLANGGFECGECKTGYLDCDGDGSCETADNGSAGPHARFQGCEAIVCDSGYLNCNGDATDGCEVQAGGSCPVNGQVGTYGNTCNGNQPPSCSVFAQNYATVQTEGGETVTSKLQIDEDGNVNIPSGAKFMVGGVSIAGGNQVKDCSAGQIKLGTQCVNVPQCEFLKFEGNGFSCAEPPKVEAAKENNCPSGQVRIGATCQAIPTCELLRFDAANSKFLCAKMPEGKVADGTTDTTQVEELVNTKFVRLATNLESNFNQMLVSLQQQLAEGIESGKVIAVASDVTPPAPPKVSLTEPAEKVSWFGSVVDFFKNLFQ